MLNFFKKNRRTPQTGYTKLEQEDSHQTNPLPDGQYDDNRQISLLPGAPPPGTKIIKIFL